MPVSLTEARWEEFLAFKAETASRLVGLEKQAAIEAVHRANVEKRLTGIEDSLKWLVRLLIGGILAVIISFALQGGFSIGV